MDEFDAVVDAASTTTVIPTNKVNGDATKFTGPDAFSPDNWKVEATDFATHVTLTTEGGRIPIGKPRRDDFVRTHPSPDYRLGCVWMLKLDLGSKQLDKQWHLFSPAAATEALLSPDLSPMMRQATLFLAIDRANNLRIWPVRHATDDWAASEMEAARVAEQHWLRLVPHSTSFHRTIARGTLPEPQWPIEPFAALLRRAFGSEYLISDLKHPKIRALLGEE